MVTAGVSNLGLDSVGMLLSIPKWSPALGLGRRGSTSRARGLGGGGGGGGAIGRGERCERLERGVRFVQRWRRRRELFDGFAFRATAADDVEQEEEVEVETDKEAAAAAVPSSSSSSSSSVQRDLELPSKEMAKISRIEQQQQQQRTGGRKLPGTRTGIPRILSSIVEEWTSFTSVREKGDVRDVVLMSLSFAVLIYISQHLVHAYCAFKHIYFNHY